MTNIASILNRYNPDNVAKEIASRAKLLRLNRNITQQQLSKRTGVSLGSIKRFESTGLVSLQNLLRIAVTLDAVDDFKQLFSHPSYNSIEEVVKQKKVKNRQRARNSED
ncbi:MAG: helix-turn-helix transcriptional regulator [Tenuifilaceae bacterium]|nr:helix-turn-helix transcriptional regulator [Tenuifilaceae bacterium]